MELQDMKMTSSRQDDNKEVVLLDEEEGPLPGFRFHPTDDELVSFYLKRKIQKRPISLDIIKQIDIYQHDPWELAKASSVGDKEWYFYCKRGRKYKNRVRPNRVITGSGFWKATGIDKPVYSNGGEGHRCVGLKKSLVYHRGNAGKGTKTDWMLHEFRLPTDDQQHSGAGPKDTLQEAEVWTLCRIFKRNRKHTPDWRDLSAKSPLATNNSIISSKTGSAESISNIGASCISFADPTPQQQQQSYASKNYRSNDDLKRTSIAAQSKEPNAMSAFYSTSCTNIAGPQYSVPRLMADTTPLDASNLSSPLNQSSSVDGHGSQFLAGYRGNWDDLSSVIEFATRSPLYEQHYMYN